MNLHSLLTGLPIPRCSCGRTVYAMGLCYEHAQAACAPQRYCELCDRVVPAKERECKRCGADTVRLPK